MPTPAERQALLFVAAVVTLGVGTRACRATFREPPSVSDRAALAEQIAAVDSAVAAGGVRRKPVRPTAAARRPPPGAEAAPLRAGPGAPNSRSTPPVPVAPIDMDVATAAELDRLPGIGPSLASRIVEDRERLGPFGSLQGLERVKGIGPALAARLQPHVTFSLPPRLSDTEPRARAGSRHP